MCYYSSNQFSVSNIFTTTNVITISTVLIFLAIYIIRLSYIMKHRLKNSYLYYGTVKHSRLKGGSTHSFQYPICFAYLDVIEISQLGWSCWPLFKLNSPWFTFSSLENRHHLTQLYCDNKSYDLPQRVRTFVRNATKHKRSVGSISILTHLTYFGYCFNPISIYFINYDSYATLEGMAQNNNENSNAKHEGIAQNNNENETFKEMIITEVSNTPWIEQHAYMLDENVENVTIQRNVNNAMSSDDLDKNNRVNVTDNIEATWLKVFHVSPFMEMDYQYNFIFSRPDKTLSVRSKLIKLATKEVWFTASFNLQRIPFSPRNLLFILVFYPLHTRLIQVLIHWEAVRLWLKGIPTFTHPNNVDINFGFGITDKILISLFSKVQENVKYLLSLLNGKSTNQ